MEYSKVSPERARIAVQRLINSHFHNENRAQCRIPCDPENDDDLVAARYINETEDAHAKLVAALKAVAQRKLKDGTFCWCGMGYSVEDTHYPFCKRARAALKEVGE